MSRYHRDNVIAGAVMALLFLIGKGLWELWRWLMN
jgi:hypothetical protein